MMAVAPVSLLVRLLSTACFFGLLSAPAFSQTATPITPTTVVPGNAVPPGADTPGLKADQTAGQGALVSILQASRPDYDAQGQHLGSFILLPTLDVTETYSSNVYAATFDTKHDFFTTVSPTVSLNSGWSRNFVGVTLGGEINRYSEFVSENTSNFNSLASGRYDILEGVYINGNAGFQLLHEPRGSPNAVNGEFPTEYHVAHAELGFVKDNAVIGLKINGSINHYDYFDVPAMNPTEPVIIETDRNRTEYEITAEGTYELAPHYRAVLRASGNERHYDHRFDEGGFERSSTGYEVDAGIALNISSKIDGEFYVGYLNQSFDDPRFSSASQPGFGANLLWNVDGLTSVRGSLSRTVEETIVTQASSFVQTAVNVSVEHAFRDNILATVGFNYAHQDYQNFGRIDDIYGFNIEGRYLITRNLATSLNVGYTSKVSNAIGDAQLSPYDQAIVALRLRLQY
jgi:hypothetical protein